MISALDTSVLLDVFLPDPVFHDASLKALEWAYQKGRLLIVEAVYAELSGQFASQSKLDFVLEESGIEVEALGREAAYRAGQAFRKYRRAGGKRDRIITDFLIGSHASARASHLITRDRGFYRSHFQKLIVIDPLSAP
jgi:predicted nucleic acid-binding protein